MRELILDIETTGLDLDSNRIIEIGMIEQIHHQRTGMEYQRYINPERLIEEEALKIHGISNEFLQDKPKFSEIADEFLEIIGDSNLVIHNAEFDVPFINMELQRCGKGTIGFDRVVDTLELARRVLPSKAQHNLDALGNHYRLDLSIRSMHGALIDAQILSEIYNKLNQEGGKDLFADIDPTATKQTRKFLERSIPIKFSITEEELASHEEYVNTNLEPDNLWSQISDK
ncbi:MAG: DNA polymerase III subunit epsilon [Rhodobacteraceae bacterium]|nr:DNA polymerase III subunit epsilon [Paracoccaceae bacterium]